MIENVRYWAAVAVMLLMSLLATCGSAAAGISGRTPEAPPPNVAVIDAAQS